VVTQSTFASSLDTDLLDQPDVAVGVIEGDEGVVAAALWVGAGRLATLLEVEDLADLDAALCQLGPGGVDVGDDQVQALDGAGRSSFFITAIEQAEPGGVVWTTRKSSPAL
jgi:hypothetical protein